MINGKLRVIELFAGIGACHNALKRTGLDYEIVDVVEFNAIAVQAYNAIHKTNWTTQNVLDWNKNIKCDYLHASTPCQAFSTNGHQLGENDARGFPLWAATLNVIKLSEPKFITLENVRGLLLEKHKRLLNYYINELDNLGYKSNVIKINSKDYGIPQNRERVFIISIKRNLVNKNNRIEFKKPEKKLLKNLLEPDAIWQNYTVENFNTKYKYAYITNHLGSYKNKAIEVDIFKEPKDWQISIQAMLKNVDFSELKNSDLNVEHLKLDNIILTTEKITEITEKVVEDYSFKSNGARFNNSNEMISTLDTTALNKSIMDVNIKKVVEDYTFKSNGAKYNNIEGLSPTLDTKCSQKSILSIAFNEDRNFKNSNGILGTLTATTPDFKNKIMEIETETEQENLTLNIKYRKLTALELCRLMDFEDQDYYNMLNANISIPQMGILFGNSMVVVCVYNVITKIFNHFL